MQIGESFGIIPLLNCDRRENILGFSEVTSKQKLKSEEDTERSHEERV